MAKLIGHTGAAKPQVSEIALQTDLCDTIYINRDRLVAYTIAVVQNTQSLQYKQMQIALQMAQNQASLENPLRAKQLMKAHFNLAVLTEDTESGKPVNAQKKENAVADPDLSTSASDQETTHKTPYRSNSAVKTTRRAQPTSAVSPTCRRNYNLVHGIPAGYESDNSWDCNSTIGEPDCMRNNDITPLVAFRVWTNCPNRGWGQSYGQGNNINMTNGNAPYSRLWHRQPYGRWTRNQQALRARAYHKWQCHYQVP